MTTAHAGHRQHQQLALRNACRFAFETMDRRFAYAEGQATVVLTVNSGYE